MTKELKPSLASPIHSFFSLSSSSFSNGWKKRKGRGEGWGGGGGGGGKEALPLSQLLLVLEGGGIFYFFCRGRKRGRVRIWRLGLEFGDGEKVTQDKSLVWRKGFKNDSVRTYVNVCVGECESVWGKGLWRGGIRGGLK